MLILIAGLVCFLLKNVNIFLNIMAKHHVTRGLLRMRYHVYLQLIQVFFWGQLDLPAQEKDAIRRLNLKNSMSAVVKLNPSLVTSDHKVAAQPSAYQVTFVEEGQDQQIAIVGRPFEFGIDLKGDRVNGRSTSKEVTTHTRLLLHLK